MYEWITTLKNGHISATDGDRWGLLSTSTTEEDSEWVHAIIPVDLVVTIDASLHSLEIEGWRWHGPQRKHCIQQLFYCCVCICCCWNTVTEMLPRNCHLFWLNYSTFQVSCHIVPSLRLFCNFRGCNVGINDGKLYEIRHWIGFRCHNTPDFIKTGWGIQK
jgi:hypothetical protein